MTHTTKDLRGDDIIDSRDIIARLDELESDRDSALEAARDAHDADASETCDICGAYHPVDFDGDCRQDDARLAEPQPFDESKWVWDDSDADELAALKALANEAEGYGDWRHGETLIRDDHFEDYARQLADDLGLLADCDKWPATCIDWERAASELQQDYTSVEFDGTTYWMRS